MNSFIWLGLAVLMALIEVLSVGLVTLWFVVGALVAFVANLLGASIFVQVILFLVVSVICLVALRPFFVKYRRRGKLEEPSVVGRHAVVVEAIDNDKLTGRVETSDRMTWAARSQDGTPIAPGEVVSIIGQKSVKLIVERKVS